MRKRVTILINGDGGHKSQMQRLFDKIKKVDNGVYINLSEPGASINGVEYVYNLFPLRDKHSRFKTILLLPVIIVSYFTVIILCLIKYKVSGIISTGPGIAIPVSIFLKLFGTKVIYIETWSRFHTRSFSGWLMYKFADKFYIQNYSLLKLYPKGIYCGLL